MNYSSFSVFAAFQPTTHTMGATKNAHPQRRATMPYLFSTGESSAHPYNGPANSSVLLNDRYTVMMERFQLRQLQPGKHGSEAAISLRSLGSRANHAYTASNHDGITRAGSTRRLSASTISSLFPPEEYWIDRLLRVGEMLVNALWTPFSPYGWFTIVRHTVLTLALGVHLVWLPFKLTFVDCEPTHNPPDAFVKVVFFVDWLLTFNTAIINDEGALVVSRSAISRHYLTHWCIPDLFSSFAVYSFTGWAFHLPSWIGTTFDIVCSIGRIVHFFSSTKLLWLLRDMPNKDKTRLASVYYSRNSHLLRIMWIVALNLLVAHYVACVWKLLANPALTHSRALSCAENYASRLVSALQLLLGQGVATESTSQRILGPFVLLAGSVFLALVFGDVAVLVSNFNANTNEYKRKMEYITAIMESNGLPPILQDRILQYYGYLWKEYKSLNGMILQQLSKELTHTLELEVVLSKCAKLVMCVPFWKDCSPDFEKQLILHLKIRVYLPDDCVIRSREVGDEFFMVNRGNCELVTLPDSTDHRSSIESWPDMARRRSSTMHQPRTAILKCGDSFGEMALIMNYFHTADVHAVSYVEMCVLRREDFQEMLVRYPSDRKLVLSRMVLKYMKKNALHQKLCPLLQMVREQFENEDMGLDEAAVHLIEAMNDDSVKDETVKFGLDADFKIRSLVHELAKDTSLEAAQETKSETAQEVESTSAGSSRSSEASNEDDDEEMVPLEDRLTRMEQSQVQMAELLRSISIEIDVFRNLQRELFTN